MRISTTYVLIVGLLSATSARADEEPRPTVQNRYANKERSFYAHLGGTLHIRNDFYNSFGGGLEAGYYPVESVGLEVRCLYLRTRLSRTARRVKKRTGLVPDAQPQHLLATLGGRYSVGYGKVLMLDSLVVHFDPQLVLSGGIALTDSRTIPTLTAGFAILTHLLGGAQVKLDLALSIQWERRARGWIPTLGFFPVLGFGWSSEKAPEGKR